MKQHIILIAGLFLLVTSVADAGPRARRFNRVDKNNDGRIGPHEAVAAHRAARARAEVDTPREARADLNGDGVVQPREAHRAWHFRRARVNTPLEEKYDADGNGFLSFAESRELIKDRLRVINTHGRAKVNTPLEKEFDADGDGVINRAEAEAIRAAFNL